MLKRALFALSMLSSVTLFGQVSQGELLEKQMWADIKDQNWQGVESHIAADFQSIHPDGTRTREQEMAGLENLKVGKYTISDMKVTEDGGTLVVTYMIAIQETMDDKSLSNKPTSRLSVWRNNGETWHWVAHADLNAAK